MLNAYLEGKDLYSVIAASALKIPYGECLEFWPEGTELEIDGKKVIAGNKTHKNVQGKKNRGVGKILQLASTYGMSARSAADMLGKSPEEGKELLDNFFSGFPQVKEAIDNSKKSLKERGYVEDWYGRRRHLPEYFLPEYEISYIKKEKNEDEAFNPIIGCGDLDILTNDMKDYLARAKNCRGKQFDELSKEAEKDGYRLMSNSGRIAQTERQCFNARIQGGAATLTKIAMVNIHNDELLKQYGAHLVCSVHDEILVECYDFYNEQVEQRLPEIMIGAAKPYMKVPMKCDPYNVQRWYGDEMANHFIDDFKKLQAKGKSSQEAIDEIIAENEEIPKQSIIDVLEGRKIVVEW